MPDPIKDPLQQLKAAAREIHHQFTDNQGSDESIEQYNARYVEARRRLIGAAYAYCRYGEGCKHEVVWTAPPPRK